MTCTAVCGPAELQRLRLPRNDVVVERVDGGPAAAGGDISGDSGEDSGGDISGEIAFSAIDGPFAHYRRTVAASERPDGSFEVDQRISYRLSVPVWGVILTPAVNRQLRRPPPDGRQPWWAPAERLDPRAGQVLGVLCLLAVVAGYLGTLLSQSITFALDEFGAGVTTQGNVLTGVRVGVLLALALVAVADRRGRRPIMLFSATGGSLAAAAGAASVGVWSYGASQTVSRGLSTTMFVLLLVIAAEEVPAGARAYAVSVLTMASGLGSGMVVWLLPFADFGTRAWRVLFLAPLLGLPLVLFCARRLPESKRFSGAAAGAAEAAPTPTGTADAEQRRRRRRRLLLLGAGALLFSMYAAPASQYLNEFLRTERFFSASRITVFQLSINTPAAIGILLAGRFSDVRGRRRIGALGLAGGAAFAALRYAHDGWPMWMWGVLAGIFGAASVPILGAFGAELFGTGRRAISNGQLSVLGVIGSMIGLQIVGRVTDLTGNFGEVFAWLTAAPLLVALLVLFAFPETASRELEDLNPEDEAPPAGAPPPVGH